MALPGSWLRPRSVLCGNRSQSAKARGKGRPGHPGSPSPGGLSAACEPLPAPSSQAGGRMIGLSRHLRLRTAHACKPEADCRRPAGSAQHRRAVGPGEPADEDPTAAPGAAIPDAALPGANQRALHMRGRPIPIGPSCSSRPPPESWPMRCWHRTSHVTGKSLVDCFHRSDNWENTRNPRTRFPGSVLFTHSTPTNYRGLTMTDPLSYLLSQTLRKGYLSAYLSGQGRHPRSGWSVHSEWAPQSVL